MVGDIELELWAKEIAKAYRNFIQLCMEGYWDDTIFHRIIKGFITQGGDPTGTREGGKIYGAPFKVLVDMDRKILMVAVRNKVAGV
ncbi:Peptidyl-prolyl cis-trans isomerase CWC27 like protein [Eufriesea mexicana]|uniref:Peptidyl-prolyl cis-trans isomerase n=1 Tax=Eufriesea mexicana TaxID=516756 RepID=A0A310SHN2_9HYME|nr:Peptidyl-prolyl cis-trans isomerase CWC27 like protein [Eufriesea mexicana]OAD62100.1 Peptidyl-prolyl cis-trans isomerase CWC27 like protein [Eufriesea mexicana]